MKNFKTKRQIKEELEISDSNNLYYRAKLDKIQGILKGQKENNTNPYTVLRDLNEVMYYFNKEDYNAEKLQ